MSYGRRTILLGVLIAALSGCSRQDYAQTPPDVADSFPIEAEAAGANPQLAESDGPQAVLHTTAGDITILLYPDQAPKAVENFIALARAGYYDGTLFHYAKRDELTQTGKPGDPEAEENSIWGHPFEHEYSDGLHHFPGAVGMADSNGSLSQFYILVRDIIPEDERIIPANLYMNELVQIRGGELNQRNEKTLLTEDEIAEFESALNEEIQAIATEGIPPEFERKYQPAIETYNRLGGAWSLDYKNTVFGQVIEGLNVAEAITQVKVEAVNRQPKKDVVITYIEIIE